jgi:hypothetical protein
MTSPEGPKARYTAKEASEAYISHPPSDEELDKVSDAQKLITDEWTGEPPTQTGEEAKIAEEGPWQKSGASQ